MAAKHPGFAKVQSSIAKKEGISKDRAGAILAASSRGASKGAKKANQHLNRVKGGVDSISTGSMKGKCLTQDRKDNLASKAAFKKCGDWACGNS